MGFLELLKLRRHLKAARKLINYATENEQKQCFGETIKSQREAVHLLQHIINNEVKSKTVKKELMEQVVQIIKRTAALENIVAQNEGLAKHRQMQETDGKKNLNVEQILSEYFESKQGQKHTDEQKKSIVNMSKIVNISKPTTKLSDVFGMEGNVGP